MPKSRVKGAFRLLFLGAAFTSLYSLAHPAYAQDAGPEGGDRFYASSYLPLRHWAYPYLNLLVDRGRLPDLSRARRPYRRADIITALRTARSDGVLRSNELDWATDIEAELAYHGSLSQRQVSQPFRFGGELSAGMKAVSQRHRDPLRPEGNGAVWPVFEVDLRASAPHVASAFQFRWDRHYIYDPQFENGRVGEYRACDPLIDECSYRIEEAYVEVQTKYVGVFFGRMDRDQGVSRQLGFLISDYNYSYDHLGYRLGSSKLALTGMFTPLSDFPSDTARYVSSHRLDWQIRDNLLLSVGESTIWGGPDAKVDFALINPLNIWEITGKGTRQRNTMGLVELWWRPFPFIAGYGSALVDNTRVNDPGVKQGLTQYGAAFGLQLPTLASNFSLDTDLSILSSLVYRSRVGFQEYYTINSVGIARDNTDTVTLTAKGTWLLGRKVVLEPGMVFQQKGEGDITQVWPDSAFTTYPNLLVGTVQSTWRPSLDGRLHHPLGDIVWNAGVNVVKNKGNVAADWAAEFVGSAIVRIRWSFSNILGES